MLPMIVPIASLLMGVSLLLLGNGLLNTLLALRGSHEGYSDSLIGLISSGYFIGFFIGFYAAIPVLRRIGHIRAFALCAAIAASVVLLHLLLVSPWTWLALRVVTGTVLVILYTVIESWLNDQTPSSSRGRVFAVYMAVNLGSLALAQQLLRLDSSTGYLLFAVSAMLVCISLVPITWTRLHQPQVADIRKLSLKRLYQAAPAAVAGALLSGVAMGGFWGLGPLYAQKIGFDTGNIAMFMSCAILGGAAFQFPLGRFSDRHDRRRVLLGVSVAASAVALAMWMLPDTPWLVFTLVALWGGAAFAIYPVAVAHLVDYLKPGEVLSGGSSLLLLHGVGAAVGPSLAGALMAAISAHALQLFYAITLLLLALYVWLQLQRPPQEQPEEPEDPAAFVPMLRTTPTVLEMLPDEPRPDSSDVAPDTAAQAGRQDDMPDSEPALRS